MIFIKNCVFNITLEIFHIIVRTENVKVCVGKVISHPTPNENWTIINLQRV